MGGAVVNQIKKKKMPSADRPSTGSTTPEPLAAKQLIYKLFKIKSTACRSCSRCKSRVFGDEAHRLGHIIHAALDSDSSDDGPLGLSWCPNFHVGEFEGDENYLYSD